MDKKTISTYIAVGIAVVFFLAVFSRIYYPLPRPFLLNIFNSNISQTHQAIDRAGIFKDTDTSRSKTVLDGLVEIIDLKEGTGQPVGHGDTVRIRYVGTFVDKETKETVEFDKNVDEGYVFTIGSGQVIAGFDVGVTGMRKKGNRIISIKPEAGYGNRQVGNIPPNTTLQFLIELYEVE